ncbi:glutathione S-transferase [Pseudorhodobacter turbinis]|uniref:Glutathione S-transferase n=1 Tax=Pseudorhodobacter turbinis TaxID=2500533 RepID=A0A4P8EHF6_9RHOB|nr:glutathione S-transferase [Pseudorhodobacter turbinis]QCO56173.1 glutathione S-transferase [Pseudorhodobacter turbinis]
MRLFYSPTSPYARKIMVLLAEAGKSDAITLEVASGNPVNVGTAPLAQNPLGKIPALEREGACALYDSRVITRYLDTHFEAGLYPEGARLWDTLTLEATADGMLDAAILMVYETRVRPEDKRYDAWVEGQWAKVDRALDALENRWMAHLHGALDMGQIAVACALAYVDFRHGVRNWREGRPALAKWEADFAARDSMKATVPPA